MSFTYKGLEALYQRHIVTDKEMNEQLEKMLEQNHKIVNITERPARLGDELILDYAGFVGSEQFQGGTAQKQSLVLGSGSFIPGFEEQLIGAVPGQSVTVKVTFPKDYHAPKLAGKAARFECLVHEIRIKSFYQPDDEFANAMGMASFEHLKEELRSSMQAYADNMAELDLGDQLLRMAADTLEDFQPDEAEVEKAVDSQMETMRAQLSQQGLTMEMYFQFSGTSEEQLRSDMRGEAVNAVRLSAAVERIAQLEGLSASQEDIDQTLDNICQQNQMTREQLQEHYDKEFEEAVVYSILMRKAMRVVQDNADLTEIFT